MRNYPSKMKSYVALLRGINVSGKNLLPMEELRNLMEVLGAESVRTYIQSGNVIFCSVESEEEWEQKIAKEILEKYGYEVPVMVRDKEYLTQVYKENVFLKRGEDEKNLHITFLRNSADEGAHDRMTGKFQDDDYDFGNRCVYIYCKYGYGKTKLNNTYLENKLQTVATTRNWNTLRTLLAMLE